LRRSRERGAARLKTHECQGSTKRLNFSGAENGGQPENAGKRRKRRSGRKRVRGKLPPPPKPESAAASKELEPRAGHCPKEATPAALAIHGHEKRWRGGKKNGPDFGQERRLVGGEGQCSEPETMRMPAERGLFPCRVKRAARLMRRLGRSWIKSTKALREEGRRGGRLHPVTRQARRWRDMRDSPDAEGQRRTAGPAMSIAY